MQDILGVCCRKPIRLLSATTTSINRFCHSGELLLYLHASYLHTARIGIQSVVSLLLSEAINGNATCPFLKFGHRTQLSSYQGSQMF